MWKLTHSNCLVILESWLTDSWSRRLWTKVQSLYQLTVERKEMKKIGVQTSTRLMIRYRIHSWLMTQELEVCQRRCRSSLGLIWPISCAKIWSSDSAITISCCSSLSWSNLIRKPRVKSQKSSSDISASTKPLWRNSWKSWTRVTIWICSLIARFLWSILQHHGRIFSSVATILDRQKWPR